MSEATAKITTVAEALTALRALQKDFTEQRNHYRTLITNQDRNLLNCMPSSSTIRACRENEARWDAEARKMQQRIDAVQRQIDEALGVADA